MEMDPLTWVASGDPMLPTKPPKPAWVGEKVTCNAQLAPTARVAGNAPHVLVVMENVGEPESVMADRVTGCCATLVTVSATVFGFERGTSPNLMEVAERESTSKLSGATLRIRLLSLSAAYKVPFGLR